MTMTRTNPISIPEIQGRGSLSPYDGRSITTEGMVTAVNDSKTSPGFFLQDLQGDGDIATSDGLFVSTLRLDESLREKFNPGAKVKVSGRVVETNQLTTIEATANGIVPGKGRRGTLEDLPKPTRLELPETQAGKLGYLEAREGMLATLDDATVIGASSKYGNFTVADAATSPARQFDNKLEGRRLLVSGRIGPGTQMGVGDKVEGLFGPVAQVKSGDFELWQSRPYESVTRGPYPAKAWGDLDFDDKIGPNDLAGIKARVGEPAGGPLDPADLNGDGKISTTDVNQAKARGARVSGEPTYRVATMNVENFFDDVDAPPPVDDDVPSTNSYLNKLARIAGSIRDGLGMPDVLALQEVEGPQVLRDLVARPELKDLGYKFALLPTTGHRSINPAILYRSDRVELDNIRQVQKLLDPKTAPKSLHLRPPVDGADPKPVPLFSREPLLADVKVTKDGRTDQFTLVVNHLISKFSPQGLPTEPLRTAQAKFLNGLVSDLRKSDPAHEVVVVGDLNDTPASKPLKTLTGPAKNPTLINATEKLTPQGERYSYNYKGQSELIDHVLHTPGMSERVERAGVRHINSDLPVSHTWGSGPHGSSDHDSPYIDVRLPGVSAAMQAAAGAATLTDAADDA